MCFDISVAMPMTLPVSLVLHTMYTELRSHNIHGFPSEVINQQTDCMALMEISRDYQRLI